MSDTKSRKGMFNLREDSRNPAHVRATLFAHGANCGQLCLRVGEFETLKARLSALDGCVPERLLDLVGDSHRALVALLAPEPGGADLRFQAYKHLKTTFRAFAPDMFEKGKERSRHKDGPIMADGRNRNDPWG